MSQDIKLKSISNRYKEYSESLCEVADQIKKDSIDTDVIGMISIVFRSDGCYRVYTSSGMDRHRKIGVLMEMVNELLNPPPL